MKKSINDDIGYIEGHGYGKSMIKHIDKTHYETIEGAITAKQTLVDQFESQFGYCRYMESFDYNYSSAVGMLDALREHKDGQGKG